MTVQAAALPDLVIVDLFVSEVGGLDWAVEPLTPDQDYELNVVVENLGETDVPSVRVQILLDGTLFAATEVPGFAGVSELAFWRWTATPGDHTLEARVDPDDQVREENEFNNVWQDFVSVGEGVVTNTPPVAFFTFTPLLATVGQEVFFDASSTTDAEEPPEVLEYAWDFNWDEFGDSYEMPFSPGNFSPTWVYGTDGTFTVTLDVRDSQGAVGRAQRNITIQRGAAPEQPDLAVSNLFVSEVGAGDWAQRPLTAEQQYELNAVVSNLGEADAPSVRVQILLDGTLFGEETVALAPGAFWIVFFPWTATPGEHTLGARVDPDGQIPETDEANNVAQSAFLSAPRCRPSSHQAGS